MSFLNCRGERMIGFVYINTSLLGYKQAKETGYILCKIGEVEQSLEKRTKIDAGDVFYHNLAYITAPYGLLTTLESAAHDKLDKYSLAKTPFVRGKIEWFYMPIKVFVEFLKEPLMGRNWEINKSNEMKLQLEEWEKILKNGIDQ